VTVVDPNAARLETARLLGCTQTAESADGIEMPRAGMSLSTAPAW
jgi:hypothetical protein